MLYLCIELCAVDKRPNLPFSPTMSTHHSCFGLLLSPGRNVNHSDMNLLEEVSFSNSSDPSASAADHTNANPRYLVGPGARGGNQGKTYTISGLWDPNKPDFAILNSETHRGELMLVCTIYYL